MSAVNEPRFQRLAERVAELGGRPLAELVLEATGDESRARALLERYARLDRVTLRALGGDRFPPRPPLRLVGGRHE